MGNNSKTIVYLTINNINHKIYVGVHNTKTTKFDGYLGNGVNIHRPSSILHPKDPFQYAVKKYGFDNFTRVTLFVCDTREEALEIEKFIVNKEFVKREDTYNITLGGGSPPIVKREVFQYNLEGDFVAKYDSLLEAAEAIGFKNGSAIGYAILYKTTCGESLWTDFYIEKLDITLYKTSLQRKEVYVYDSKGMFIKQLPSLSQTAKYFKVTLGPVQRAIASQTKIKNCYLSFEYFETFEKKISQRHYGDPMHQYSLSGEYIKTFNNVSEVVKLLGKTYNQIPQSIKTGTTCGGFQWSWERLDSLPDRQKSKSSPRKVGQYDTDGNLIKIYPTVGECRKDFANISKCLKGFATHCKGYTFKYILS